LVACLLCFAFDSGQLNPTVSGEAQEYELALASASRLHPHTVDRSEGIGPATHVAAQNVAIRKRRRKIMNFMAPGNRQAQLASTRNLKMARSAHAFVRGSTAEFYEWLENGNAGRVPEGPAVWICGDCHSGNLGPIADSKGRIEIQIRDLDQTVIGNPNHDLIRLALSLASAARGSALPGVATAQMLEHMMAGYESGIKVNPVRTKVEEQRPECIRVVMKRAMGRTSKHLARERLEDTRPTIPLGKRFWPLTREEKRELVALFESKAVRELVA
jgi:uncharacterized protein (DUF2252 family)